VAKKPSPWVTINHAQWNIPAFVKLTGKVPQGFKPYNPQVPPGYYDPALDYQKAAANRGYLQTQGDTTLANTRALEDYNTGIGQLDLAERQYDETYNRNVGLLTRRYENLGVAQGERQNAYGVVPGGGAALQSAAKRAANQAVEQGGLDLARSQFREGIEGPAGHPELGQRGALSTAYGRGVDDRTLALTRAGKENAFYGQAIEKQKAYQNQQLANPWVAPPKPANERTLPGGQHVRTVTAGGYRYTYDKTGKIISKKRV
jgi:hypothetical protein